MARKMRARDMSTIRMMQVRVAKEGAIIFNPSSSKRLSYWADEKKTKRAVYSVPVAPYWHRRVKDGAVELMKDAPKEDESKKDAPAPVPNMSGKKGK